MNIYTKARALFAAGQTPFAFAAVIRATGSTPQKAGAKAIFEASGAIHGTLGGGCLEAESRKRAMDAMDDGHARVFDLNLNDDFGWDDGLICGGQVRVLVEPNVERNREVFAKAASSIESGLRGVLVATILDGQVQPFRFVPESEIELGQTVPASDAIRRCLDESRPGYFATDSDGFEEIYIEPVAPPQILLIAGGGHVGQATARLGAWLGFDVVVIDDRPQFTNPALYPQGVQTICGDIPKEVAAIPITVNTYVLIVTRGHRHDGVVLKECIHSPAAYIGMIGSKRKAHIIRKGLIEEGHAAEADFDRVFSPVGLDIGALTVEEIATSIAAELVAARRNRLGAGKPLSVYSAS